MSDADARVKKAEEERDSALEILRRSVNFVRAETFFVDMNEGHPDYELTKVLYDGINELLGMSTKQRIQELHDVDLDRVKAEKRCKEYAEQIDELNAQLKLACGFLCTTAERFKDDTPEGALERVKRMHKNLKESEHAGT